MLLTKVPINQKPVDEKRIIDISRDFDFSNLEIRPTNIQNYWYFYNKLEKCFGDTFILTDQPIVQKRCVLQLIQNEEGFLTPRLDFFIWDKSKNKKLEENTKITICDRCVKAEVNLDSDGSESFWKLVGFLSTIKNIDLKNFGIYKVIDSSTYISEFKSKKDYEKVEELKKIFSDPNLDESAIKKALSDTRKTVIDEFRKLLEDEKYVTVYRTEKSIGDPREEAIWHHFLKNNDWLLGLNVDIRFIQDFTDEVNVGVQNTTGTGSPKTDLMGISDYTVLVELKTANTNFFTDNKKNTSRANTWSFTDKLIDGMSQCLGQKFDWDKTHKIKDLVDNNKNVLSQEKHRTVNPKTIFIIGNKQKELPCESINLDVIQKRDTLQRFIRNSRDIEIISFDELYERAFFIVHNKKAPKLNLGNAGDETLEIPS